MSRIYFIQAGGEGGPIKIGYTAGPVRRRLANLQIGCPTALRLLGSYPGDAREEARLHALFQAHTVRNEWFQPHADVLSAVHHLSEPTSGFDALPENPMTFIRECVLRVTQAEMAMIADVSQATISKWEAGIHTPDLQQIGRVRDQMRRRSIAWDDCWFFEAPDVMPAALRSASGTAGSPPVAGLIAELGGATAVAALLDVPMTTVASWKSRGSIPVEHWPAVIAAAEECDVRGVSYEKLVSFHTCKAALNGAPVGEPAGAQS